MAAAAATGPVTRAKAAGGIRLGNLYFSSGLTGVRPEARKDPLAFGGDIKEQTKRILELHKANLESMGSSLENVLKVTVFLADLKDYDRMNAVYRSYDWGMVPPVRTTTSAAGVPGNSLVEIDVIAYI